MPNNNFVRDILPAGNRRINLTKGREKEKGPEKPRRRLPNFFKSGFRVGKLKFIVGAVVLYAAVLVTVGFFSRAEVVLRLKSENLDVNSLVSAGASSADILAEGVIFNDQLVRSARTVGVKDFNERSSGTVIIYNAYSSEPQSLVAGTRFEASGGKIYRINKPVTVPGAKIIDGKIEPSSIEAQIFADQPGAGYDTGLTDFVIPGFKGTPKYDKFYARSKTPISGGFVGRANVVAEKDAAELVKNIEEELKRVLIAKMQTDLPEGFFVPEGVYQYETETRSVEPAIGSKADEFKLTMDGKLKVFFVRKEDVKKNILENYKSDPNFANIDIPNFGDLRVVAESPDFKSFTLNLRVKGQAKAVWNVEAGRLVEELILAANGAERLKIFQNYPQIKQAGIAYRPFWWRIFPDRAERVFINSSY
ncbi:MAG: hypothetical protein AAB527_02890 [Patescibacteria group bacterium]